MVKRHFFSYPFKDFTLGIFLASKMEVLLFSVLFYSSLQKLHGWKIHINPSLVSLPSSLRLPLSLTLLQALTELASSAYNTIPPLSLLPPHLKNSAQATSSRKHSIWP